MLTAIKTLHSKLFELEKWRIGIVHQSLSEILNSGVQPTNIEWFNCHRYDFVADPFLFTLDDQLYLACEVFDYLRGKGKLKCFDLAGREYPFFEAINALGGHKSYPLIVEHGGEYYAIPETSDRHEIALYRFDRESEQFLWHQALLSDGDYVDTSLVEHEGHWYLFTSGVRDPFTQRLFVADEFAGPYHEHPQSPICRDICGGRNGGAIVSLDNQYYRLGQNCDGAYGKSLLVMQINTLTPTQYAESVFNEIHAVEPYGDGIHTLSYCEGVTVIDAKVHTYYLLNLVKKMAFKLMERFDIERHYD
ncbi:hypothetical protein R1U54_001136 [Vibrio fluvialis]|nr:hypothetical protein [Vibrio fluvialis]ELP2651050.1 hypothetical protein [Vibrio fluvialis]